MTFKLQPIHRQPAPAPDPLDPHAVYLSPSGRRCRFLSTNPARTYATLIYDLAEGSAASSCYADGFVFSYLAWHLLRRVS